MIHLQISQVMDSQNDSKTLNNLLENVIFSLRGGEADTDLLAPDPDANYPKDRHTMKPFSILDESLASSPIHSFTKTTTSTSSSTISHPFYPMVTTTAHSTISITNPTPALRHQPTATTLPTYTTSQPHTSYNTSPSPIHPHPPSTTTAKSKTTSSTTQSKHLLFTFHFIPNHPNYISKLKLPMYIAKLCTEIQHNSELSIIKIVEEHLSKQNKHKKSKNKKAHNFKPRFQPIEHPPISPIHTVPKTHITTTTQYNPPIHKTTATQYVHPTLKTTGTQYTLPTTQNHSSTYTKSQHLPLNTTAMPYRQTPAIH